MAGCPGTLRLGLGVVGPTGRGIFLGLAGSRAPLLARPIVRDSCGSDRLVTGLAYSEQRDARDEKQHAAGYPGDNERIEIEYLAAIHKCLRDHVVAEANQQSYQ